MNAAARHARERRPAHRPDASLLLRDRIKQYVQTHLRDPDLSIHRITLALNCSKRNLHDVFEQEGTTLADYMQALHLDACNSPAHFSRVFRKRR